MTSSDFTAVGNSVRINDLKDFPHDSIIKMKVLNFMIGFIDWEG